MTALARFIRQGFIAGDVKAFTIIHQAAFAILLGASAVFLSLLRPDDALNDPWLIAGSFTLVVATVGAFFAHRFEESAVPNLVIPLLDFAALGMCRLGTYPDGAGLSILAFTPIVWLVITFRLRGAAIALVGILTTLTPVTLAGGDAPVDAAQVVLALILPVAAVLVSGMIIGFDVRLRSAQQRVQRALAEQERLTRDLAKSSALLHGAGSSIDSGLLVLDHDGTSVFENPAYSAHLAAASPDDPDADGTRTPIFFYADGTTRVPKDDTPLMRARRGEFFSHELFWIGPPEGLQRALAVSTVRWQGHPSIKPHTIVTTHDVTATQHLITAREKILASVSHELRTPLTSIMGYTELAIDELEDLTSAPASAMASHLEVIRRNSEQLYALVEDILLAQQAESQRLELTTTSVDLPSLIDDAVRSLQPTAADNEVTLRSVGFGEVTLDADAKRITQVLTNLLANGIKYSGPGHTVTAVTVDDDSGVGFDVVDDGPGIPPGERERLFTPFFRGAAARKSTQRGVGLGLSLTKTIVDAHGGTISVSSNSDHGSVFSVRFPAPRIGELQ